MNVLKCASYEIISTIIVTDIYVHSLVELKITKKCTVPLLRLQLYSYKIRRNVQILYSDVYKSF